MKLADTHGKLLRPRVAGKFLSVGNDKFYAKGVIYGTFAPDEAGENFPPAQGDRKGLRSNGLVWDERVGIGLGMILESGNAAKSVASVVKNLENLDTHVMAKLEDEADSSSLRRRKAASS